MPLLPGTLVVCLARDHLMPGATHVLRCVCIEWHDVLPVPGDAVPMAPAAANAGWHRTVHVTPARYHFLTWEAHCAIAHPHAVSNAHAIKAIGVGNVELARHARFRVGFLRAALDSPTTDVYDRAFDLYVAEKGVPSEPVTLCPRTFNPVVVVHAHAKRLPLHLDVRLRYLRAHAMQLLAQELPATGCTPDQITLLLDNPHWGVLDEALEWNMVSWHRVHEAQHIENWSIHRERRHVEWARWLRETNPNLTVFFKDYHGRKRRWDQSALDCTGWDWYFRNLT